jgi:hypothetical protein
MAEDRIQFNTTVAKETSERIGELAKLEGKNKGEFIDHIVAMWSAGEMEFEEKEVPDSITLPVPRDRQMMVDCIGSLIAAGRGVLHENYVIGALVDAKSEFVKTLPEYKDAERMRAEWGARREAQPKTLAYDRKGPSLKP